MTPTATAPPADWISRAAATVADHLEQWREEAQVATARHGEEAGRAHLAQCIETRMRWLYQTRAKHGETTP